MEFIKEFQSAYCPKAGEVVENYIVLYSETMLANVKRYGFWQLDCHEIQGCKYADSRGFCPFAKEVLDRFACN